MGVVFTTAERKLGRMVLLVGALLVVGMLTGCSDNPVTSVTSAQGMSPRPGQVVPRLNLSLDVLGVAH